jgi:hypothetical protein
MLHLTEPDRTIAEAFCVLRSDGIYAFTVWDGPEHATFLGMGIQAVMAHTDMTVPVPPGPPVFQLADRIFTVAALARMGFRDVAVRDLPVAFHGARPEDAWDFFEKSTVRTVGVVAQQTAEIQARIRGAVVEAASRYVGPVGVTIPSPALLFTALKPDSA